MKSKLDKQNPLLNFGIAWMMTEPPIIQVEFAPEFERQIRILYKRYRQIRSDV
ncbi:hypothetical protein [Stenomitos frigidus]|uniref:hypothetical protein n=1 Tax=Stenomitos frigidus TaxID=1886765 RepID=UPI001FE6C0A9|nr:hypothetical protein [Stenomitos frigidus]